MPSPTKQYVDSFSEVMEERLSENRHKGDRPGWLKETATHHAAKAVYIGQDVEDAIMAGAPVEEVRELCADAANRLMMAADCYETAPNAGRKEGK